MTTPPPYAAQPPGGGYQPAGNPPNNNLVWAILSTVLCCLPLGIVAIVKSTQVNNLWGQGRFDEARAAADSAKKFAIIGAVVGLVLLVLYIIFVVVLGAASFNVNTSTY